MVTQHELEQTVQRMEARLSLLQVPAVQDAMHHYQQLRARFAQDLQDSPRDIALAKASALMLVQAIAQSTNAA